MLKSWTLDKLYVLYIVYIVSDDVVNGALNDRRVTIVPIPKITGENQQISEWYKELIAEI